MVLMLLVIFKVMLVITCDVQGFIHITIYLHNIEDIIELAVEYLPRLAAKTGDNPPKCLTPSLVNTNETPPISPIPVKKADTFLFFYPSPKTRHISHAHTESHPMTPLYHQIP